MHRFHTVTVGGLIALAALSNLSEASTLQQYNDSDFGYQYDTIEQSGRIYEIAKGNIHSEQSVIVEDSYIKGRFHYYTNDIFASLRNGKIGIKNGPAPLEHAPVVPTYVLMKDTLTFDLRHLAPNIKVPIEFDVFFEGDLLGPLYAGDGSSSATVHAGLSTLTQGISNRPGPIRVEATYGSGPGSFDENLFMASPIGRVSNSNTHFELTRDLRGGIVNEIGFQAGVIAQDGVNAPQAITIRYNTDGPAFTSASGVFLADQVGTLAPVPLPATALLLFGAIGGIGFASRKKAREPGPQRKHKIPQAA